MKIILSGGGTIGSVSPLIAIFQEIKTQQPDAEFLWLATRKGPEHKLIKTYQIPVKSIFSGKLRRYFSFKNLLSPLWIVFGFFQSFFIILKFKPDVILSAGGFVSVPLVWAGWLLRKPALIHQQDVRAGLANKLMTKYAKIISVTFQKSLADFPKNKVVLTGNPVRADILRGSKEEGYKFFKFSPEVPTVLIIGGGTGALHLNQVVMDALPELIKFCQVIHLTGGKVEKTADHPRYQGHDFLVEQLKNAYAISDLVISRAGLSTLTELSALGKPVIIIPIPNSHQQNNAIEFFKNNAALMIEEQNLTPQDFSAAVKEVVQDQAQLQNLTRNILQIMPRDAAKNIVKMFIH